MWKDTGSGQGQCSALIRFGDDYAVVAKKATPEALAAIEAVAAENDSGIAEDETVVIVPANVLDRLRGA